MNRRQICAAAVCFLALVALVNVANAQSKDRANPTKLTSNEISGLIDSDSRGNIYYYSFWANPGEVVITLTVEPGKQVGDTASITSVIVSVFDRNAEEIANKEAVTYEGKGTAQAVARIEVSRPQRMVLGVAIPGGAVFKTVGGKYRIRIDGAVDLNQDAPSSKSTGRGITDAGLDAYETSRKLREILPKSGMLRIRMKDGSVRTIDLSKAEEITVEP